ncbi:FixH family protein [Pseudomonas saliphila]|uniref:FixH family protein n=1 Tax=Pseudomonas saliphila TaxID=2586906 RepID=UPI001239D33E|nr:FixH family protein [Pseudomonas saliphila]
MHEDDDIQPWYKQFWPWFIISILGLSVVLGLGLLYVSIINQDSMVRDNYYKEGRAINMHLGRDRMAEELNLTAEFSIDDLTREISLVLNGDLDVAPPELEFDIMSPTHAERDRTVMLRRVDARQYAGQLESGLEGRHYVDLSDPALTGDDGWRLTDELKLAPGQSYTLSPR